MSSEKTNQIARNTSYFTFALILQKIISFSYFTILARNLIPEDLGKYYLAIGLTSMFAVFMDKGMANLLVREVSRARDKAGSILGKILILKLVLSIFTLLSLLLAVNILGYAGLVRNLIYIAAIAMALDSFTLTFWAVIRGFQVLKYEAIGSVVFQLIVLTLGLYFLKSGYSLYWIIMAQVTASAFNFCYSLLLIILKFKIKIDLVLNFSRLKPIILLTIPFALFGIFQRLYTYLDTVLLSQLAGEFFVGIYQIPFKIVFALQFLPMAFIASLYPAFSSYWKKEKNSPQKISSASPPWRGGLGGCNGARGKTPPAPLGHPPQGGTLPIPQIVITFERAMNYLLIIGLPISIGVITLADKILLLFKSEYSEAILPLQIIIIALIFIFLNFPIGALLNACDRQKLNTINMGLALLVSIVLNIILIPRFAAIGASITVLVTNLQMFIIGLTIVPQILKYRPRKIISVALKVLASAVIMGIFVWFVKVYLNIFIVVILAGMIYFSALFLLGGIKKEDVLSIIKSFVKR